MGAHARAGRSNVYSRGASPTAASLTAAMHAGFINRRHDITLQNGRMAVYAIGHMLMRARAMRVLHAGCHMSFSMPDILLCEMIRMI